MGRAAGLLDRGMTGEETRRAEQTALDRLIQLQQALKPDPPVAGQQPPQQPQQPGQGAEPPQSDAIHALAELKLVKLMQEEINRRTIELEEAGQRQPLSEEQRAEVNDLADESGSTGKIIKTVQQSPPGTKWAIGTELHLVNRLKQEYPEHEIHFLSPVVCMCATMYRIDLAHLCWSLDNLVAGTPVNVIEVDEETAKWSLVALERMLEVTG